MIACVSVHMCLCPFCFEFVLIYLFTILVDIVIYTIQTQTRWKVDDIR